MAKPLRVPCLAFERGNWNEIEKHFQHAIHFRTERQMKGGSMNEVRTDIVDLASVREWAGVASDAAVWQCVIQWIDAWLTVWAERGIARNVDNIMDQVTEGWPIHRVRGCGG